MKISAYLFLAVKATYPPTDVDNPGESKTCENEVAEDDCVRLFVAKQYDCDRFTPEQQKACQGMIRRDFFKIFPFVVFILFCP